MGADRVGSGLSGPDRVGKQVRYRMIAALLRANFPLSPWEKKPRKKTLVAKRWRRAGGH